MRRALQIVERILVMVAIGTSWGLAHWIDQPNVWRPTSVFLMMMLGLAMGFLISKLPFYEERVVMVWRNMLQGIGALVWRGMYRIAPLLTFSLADYARNRQQQRELVELRQRGGKL